MTTETGSSPLDLEGLERLRSATEEWVGQLVDLSGRNTLLYFRDLSAGMLDLTEADGVGLDSLIGSHTVRLSNLFSEEDLAGAARRSRAVRAKATENFEERGLQTMYLGWGMATWTNTRGTATPAAPVLLRQARLVPRGGTGEDFDLSLPGEWEVNPTLLHLLSTDFAVSVDGTELVELVDEDADPPVLLPVLERLAKEAASVSGFAVRHRAVLGNFSYAKLPMVRDLQAGLESGLLAASDLIRAIARDPAAQEALLARHPTIDPATPDLTPPKDEFLVLDADSSQSYAINVVTHGADVVIEGPPGTGKSQTIANLIATLAARGKRILFVAEKRAAIDAVLKRLAERGLGDLVMDLHDTSGSRRRVAAQLARSLADAASVPLPDLTVEQEGLVRRRGELRAKADAFHRVRDPWGVSVWQIQSDLLGIPTETRSDQRIRGQALVALTAEAARAAAADLEAFAGLGGLAAAESPWLVALGAGTITTPEAASRALEVASTLSSRTVPEALAVLRSSLAEVGLAEPESIAEWNMTLGLLEDVRAVLGRFESEIFVADLEALTGSLARAKGNFSRGLHRLTDGAYRKARKAIRELAKASKPSGKEVLATSGATAHLVARWRARSVDGGPPRLPSDLEGVEGRYAQLRSELEVLSTFVPAFDLATLSPDALRDHLRAYLADQTTLFRLPELYRLTQSLARWGLSELVDEIRRRGLDTDGALAVWRWVWLSSVLETVSVSDPNIASFDGSAHRRTVKAYRQADVSHIASAPVRVRRAVAERVTEVRNEYRTESTLINAEAAKKQRHLPIRDLYQAAPNVLGALKPCWAMSPLVVAQILPAEKLFDYVIFDEASQVMPADAMGALMRAERAVVAGDPHQLPPTRFFVSSNDGGDDGEGATFARDVGSLLELMIALLPPPIGTKTLSWHYRSKDERLITFSNAQPSLYDGRLITFPGTQTGPMPVHHMVPFVPGRADESESVGAEVNKVVELVVEHARVCPTESLGVIAMGVKHADRIAEALRRARGIDPDLDAFMSESATEPFFVKNLERVQGDERDAIILSVGYGKSSDGRMLYNFGPINQEGGERRLNVAVTRARRSMTVVSSFGSGDIDLNKLSAEGAKMLCRYLAYAESGGTDLGPMVRDQVPLNPFEQDVFERLTEAGIPLVAQYGCSGYWIDFAAQHPTDPGRMVLAIEADGASYHSTPTARDRDRLRQDHLERLGWKFHRIWSGEWFHHRDAEVERALAAYHTAVEDCKKQKMDQGPEPEPVSITRSEESALSARPTPSSCSRKGRQPVSGGLPIDWYDLHELVSLIRWIESDTLLRTDDELIAEAMELLEFRRRGRKIVAALHAAVEKAHGDRDIGG